MDFKIVLTFAILLLALVSGHRRLSGKDILRHRRHRGSRRNSNFSSRFHGRGRDSRSRTTKVDDLVKLLPYEAEEDVKVRERMDVSLWKINEQSQTTHPHRPKRHIVQDVSVKRLAEKSQSEYSHFARDAALIHKSRSGGSPWPLPQHYKTNPNTVYTIDTEFFYFTINAFSQSCDALIQALRRYYTVITDRKPTGQSVVPATTHRNLHPLNEHPPTLTNIEVTVVDTCSEGFPGLESNESYSLHITGSTGHIKSGQVWGLMRGLQTFSQILYSRPTQSRKLFVNWTEISDFPRFPHRGVVIDTSRRYIHPDTIRKTLDAMEQNKLNVLHWNLPVDNSLLLVTKTYPQSSDKGRNAPFQFVTPFGKGSVSDSEIYDEGDIVDILEHAKQRGIRVIPELDTPGDVSNMGTYIVLSRLCAELIFRFPDLFVHLCGDDASSPCWSRSTNIDSFMKNKGMEDYKQLTSYRVKKLTKLIYGVDKKKQIIFWDDIINTAPQINKDIIIQVRRSNPGPAMTSSFEGGHRVIYSSPWCQNYTAGDRDWVKVYLADPFQHLEDPSYKELVMGGEACILWKYGNTPNLQQSMWSRMSGVAERLWSAPYVRNVVAAKVRLEEQISRMVRRNVLTGFVTGHSANSFHVP